MGRQHDIAVLAALAVLAVLDPDDHAAAVDVANLEGGHLAHPQPRAISCCQSRAVAQPRHRLQEADNLLAAEHHRQLLRLLGADDAVERLWPAQRHAEEKAQRARHLVDVRPRPAKPGQVKLVGANLLDPQAIRRTTEKTAELGNRIDVGLLGCRREVANRHVVDHPSTQRGHLSHHRISCLMIGSGQPQSSQTGAASRQVHSPLAQAGSFNTQMCRPREIKAFRARPSGRCLHHRQTNPGRIKVVLAWQVSLRSTSRTKSREGRHG